MVRWSRGRRVLAVSAAIVVAATGVASCSSDEPSTEACRPVAPGADGTTVLEVAASNMAFDFECIEVQPGPISVTFANEDSGVPHNFRVKGHGVNEATDLETGRVVQDLEFELTEVGTYEVQCDPHPNMRAAIVVADAGDDAPAS